MAAKDRFGNNLRRGCSVSDLRPDQRQNGEYLGMGKGTHILVRWESGEEENLDGRDVVFASKSFGGRRR